MPSAAHGISSSSSKHSTLRRVLTCAAAAVLLVSGLARAESLNVSIVAADDCPMVLRDAKVERTPTGIVVTYRLQNNGPDHARQLVLTAATVDWLGGVIDVRMAPVNESIGKHSTGEYRVTFAGLQPGDTDRVVFGIQAVQWAGKGPEWRTALKLSGPIAVATR